ncbi:MAG: hypothetical protein KDC53_25410, partial [Saprospiraceae bacterium]|nr:hypothetical protein [Saprospiraceae bacterium]
DSVHTQVIFIEQQDSLIFAFEKNGCTVFDTKTQERIAGMWLGGYKVLVPFRPIAIGNAEFLLPWDNQIWKINVLSKESQVIYTTESPIYQFIKAPGFYYIVTQTGEVLQVDDLFNRSRPILKLDPANEITRYFSTAFNSDDHLIWFSWNSQLFQIEPSSGIHNILYPNGIAEKRSTSPVKVFDNQLVYLEGQQIRDLNSDKLIYTIPDQCLKHGKVVNYYFDATKKLWFHVTDNNKLDSWLYFTDGSILDSLPIRAFRTHFKEDDQSQLWICTDGQGIIRVHSDLRMESTNTSDGILKSDWVVDVEFVGDSTIAIGYRYDGLHLVNLSLDSTIENFEYNPEEIHTLSNNNIKKLELDSYGRLWIGTDAGLNYLDLHTRNMERFYYDSALPFPGLIYNLLEDDYQHLWVEMNNEIYFVNLENSLEAFKLPINLTPGEDIYHHAFLKANNSIYIPTDKFVKVIDSASLKQSQKVIPLQLVGYDLLNSDNRSENPSYAHNFVTKDSNHHITLPFRENSFTINYFIPDFTHRESNEYRY